jgi:hypothetical protein
MTGGIEVQEQAVQETNAVVVPDGDDLLGRAVRFLIEGGEDKAAAILVQSRLNVILEHIWEGDEAWQQLRVGVEYVVETTRIGYEALMQKSVDADDRDWDAHEVGRSIRVALKAVTPPEVFVSGIDTRFDQSPAVAGWRDDVAAFILGREAHNQAPGGGPTKVWENLRFRSESEKRVAQALDAEGAMFFPNCRARATDDETRRTVEPDFLVCWKGKWGILEVDGEPFHPPTRTLHDHARDRVSKAHGVMVVEHFDASECFERPAEVVRKFLTLLERSR